MKETPASIIGSIILFVLNMIISIIVSAYVLASLWLWFIVPVFNLPALSVTASIGVSFFLNYLMVRSQMSQIIKLANEENAKNKDDLLTRVLKGIGKTLGSSAGFLFSGWILHKIIG